MFQSWLSWAKLGDLWISILFWGQLWDLLSCYFDIDIDRNINMDSYIYFPYDLVLKSNLYMSLVLNMFSDLEL